MQPRTRPHLLSRFGRKLGWAAVGSMIATSVLAPSAFATPSDSVGHKITICHRTNSVTNPYVIITVDYSGADGGLVHDNGNGDHTDHLGPIFDWGNPPPPPHNGDQWGDIIPAYSWAGDANHPGGSYPGLNWTAEGQAILRAGCENPNQTTTTSESTTTTETTTKPETTTTTSSEQTSTGTESSESSESSQTTSSEQTSTGTESSESSESSQTTSTEQTSTGTESSESSETTSTEQTSTGTESSESSESSQTTSTVATESGTGTESGAEGGVLGTSGSPRATPPATDTASIAAAPAGTPDGIRFILVGLAALLALVLLLQPRPETVREE